MVKQKLLIFHPVIAPYRIDLFNRLSEKFDVKICLFYRNLIDQTFDYEKTISSHFKFEPEYINKKQVLKKLKSFQPDVVMVSECGVVSCLVVAYRWLTSAKYKIISIIDDSYDMLVNDNQFSKKHEWGEKVLIPCFDDIICVEPKVCDIFRQRYEKGIFFPIIQDESRVRLHYEATLDISNSYIEKYGLKDKKVVLFVGRLVGVKNLAWAIKCFRDLHRTDVCFVIVGSGELEEELKQYVENEPSIFFAGRKEGPELWAWYNIAELFVLPSKQEPFGAVTNEALMGGCFCLISMKAGSSCLIRNHKNGYTFDPGNEKEFIQLLDQSITKVPLRSYPLKIRDNRMPYTFEQMMNDLVKQMSDL